MEVEVQRWPVSGALGMDGQQGKGSVQSWSSLSQEAKNPSNMERRCEQFVLETGRVLVQELDLLDPRCWTVQV